MSENLREVVTGRQLSSFVGQEVSITGKVISVGPNGLSMAFKSSDDVDLTIKFKKPNRDHLEGIVEVHGTCNNKDNITATEVIQFPETNEFDAQGYNTMCGFLQGVPDLWKTSS